MLRRTLAVTVGIAALGALPAHAKEGTRFHAAVTSRYGRRGHRVARRLPGGARGARGRR
jgi:hypothetical protein